MAITSGHLEQASITISHICPSKGPAKSMWSRFQGCCGISHGWNGALAGFLWFSWHDWHSLTHFSMWLSIRGHQTCIRASDFIQTTPAGALWTSSSTCFLRDWGITTLKWHRMQPWCMVSWAFRLKDGVLAWVCSLIMAIPFVWTSWLGSELHHFH